MDRDELIFFLSQNLDVSIVAVPGLIRHLFGGETRGTEVTVEIRIGGHQVASASTFIADSPRKFSR